jgi:hypothetical protein
MSSARGNGFTKTRGCPTSQSLLLYQNSELPSEHAAKISSHIAKCEFCNAELHFLAAHPPTSDGYSTAEMPLHLRVLAEGLLLKDQLQRVDLLEAIYRKQSRSQGLSFSKRIVF